MPKAVSWWQQVGLATSTVTPGGVWCKHRFSSCDLKCFWTSSSVHAIHPSIPTPPQPLSLFQFETYRWCLSRREADQPETDCEWGPWEVQGKVSSTRFRNCPYLHMLLVMGLWHMSHWTRRRHGPISCYQDTHWLVHIEFPGNMGD